LKKNFHRRATKALLSAFLQTMFTGNLEQLLKCCRRNDAKAQRVFYDSFADGMFLLCRRYLDSDMDAEEALMNGFLKFFRSLDRFRYEDDGSSIAYLKKLMVNECLMQLRGRHSFVQLPVEDFAALTDTIIDELSADEIFQLITRLPPGYRTVFNLAVVEDLSHAEIASLLGIAEGTSRSQLNKARQMLQQLLIQNNPEYAWRKSK